MNADDFLKYTWSCSACGAEVRASLREILTIRQREHLRSHKYDFGGLFDEKFLADMCISMQPDTRTPAELASRYLLA